MCVAPLTTLLAPPGNVEGNAELSEEEGSWGSDTGYPSDGSLHGDANSEALVACNAGKPLDSLPNPASLVPADVNSMAMVASNADEFVETLFDQANFELLAQQPQAVGHVASPRMLNIYESLGIEPADSVRSIADAFSMASDIFGSQTEGIRAWAARELAAGPPSPSAGATTTGSGGGCSALAATTGSGGGSTLALTLHSAVGSAAPGSSGAAPLAATLAAALQPEVEATLRAALALAELIPNSMLFHKPSAVPTSQHVANRVRHLSQCGIDSIKRAATTIRAWREFCDREHILDFGLPVIDEEMIGWFLREEDRLARDRARGTDHTGESVEHDRADGLRWLTDNAGCPFEAAKSIAVRKSSKLPHSSEPVRTRRCGRWRRWCTCCGSQCSTRAMVSSLLGPKLQLDMLRVPPHSG